MELVVQFLNIQLQEKAICQDSRKYTIARINIK
jgi:hypothetical protein